MVGAANHTLVHQPAESLRPDAVWSERAVLGSMLNNPAAVTIVRRYLTADMFSTVHHSELFALLCDLTEHHAIVDPAQVVVELSRRGQLRPWNNGATIFELWSRFPDASLEWHCIEMRKAHRHRAASVVGARLVQRLGENTDPGLVAEAAAIASVELQLLAEEPDRDQVEGLHGWSEFVDRYRDDPTQWLVPGLTRRQDIVFVLAGSGAGKSFLSRQVCLCLAAGVHPFRPERRIEPVRTLLVDLENSPYQVSEEADPLLRRVKQLGDFDEGRARVWMHQEGFNLRMSEDARLLERVIVETRPDLVAFGSLYNAYLRGSDSWDTAAEEVQGVINRLRKRHNLTFWVEHHMVRAQGGGHTGAPFGGTSWEKWPTHGRVLERAKDGDGNYTKADVYRFAVSPNFRGDRGRREFPIGLTRGGRLPWSAVWDEEEMMMLTEAGI